MKTWKKVPRKKIRQKGRETERCPWETIGFQNLGKGSAGAILQGAEPGTKKTDRGGCEVKKSPESMGEGWPSCTFTFKDGTATVTWQED